MLPWLEPKKAVSIIIARHNKPDVEAKSEVDASSSIHPDLKEAATDLLSAVKSESIIEIAHALEAAFECLDAMPHEEGEHTNEESEE
jgi:hypothetical protein